jgi:hypothetical protein
MQGSPQSLHNLLPNKKVAILLKTKPLVQQQNPIKPSLTLIKTKPIITPKQIKTIPKNTTPKHKLINIDNPTTNNSKY